MALKLNIIIVSTRPGRIGPHIARWFHDYAKENSAFDAELVDIADFNLPVFDEPRHPRLKQYEHAHTKAWSASVEAADAFVFVTPEYNYFAPPSFVNAVTYLSSEWAFKPAGLVSYGGISGGLRAAQSEKSLLTTVNVMPIPEGVAVPMAPKLITDGVFEPNELILAGAKPMLDQLHRWATALKTMRAPVSA
ncbi:NAD(P)H-dependent oxidoreductase [Mesorhizobium sp. BR1-1-16]|uniref:NADPH-dependent FMN reductase n=1 Tax=Mesorhizobium sp. BR1-1-16 TaxID=2876653 RepID=UPI001CCD6EEC|nr:NAD(P)H-dependent oxidoreductase [Mesorhizobium sp. BR1-1-16]MBZ9935158.1 NAD(P)H-dependent oxidoreductase [Mesorhizobium sp. BR1-1-16]